MLELQNVCKRFGDTAALSDVSLRVEAGTTVVLIGQSGSGKSTVLRLITGLLWPEAGELRFDGARIERSSIQALRKRMGYVIQEGGLFPHLTGHGNAALMARYLRWPEPRIERRIAELSELMQLPAELLQRYPRQLSGGQRQRVSLMRALMLDPDLLLLDEPLGALDPITRADLQSELRAIFAELGKTVVLVTHDLAEAEFFSRKLVLLRDGLIVQQGTAEELTERPENDFVTRFIQAQQRAR